MKTVLRYFSTLLLLFHLSSASAQVVTSVNYQMKYDTVNCVYDCYMIVNSGFATSAAARTQFNAQYSVIVPTGTSIAVDTSYMPLQGNLVSGTGTTPASWTISSTISDPAALPGSDFYSIVPSLSPTSRYNNLLAGDTVKLFSLDISPTVNCASDIRIYQNGVDPSSSAPGMANSDFSNGFTMGSPNQIYNANSTKITPPVPLIVDAATSCSNGIEIDLTASTSLCQAPLTYEWTGPNGFSQTAEDVSIPAAGPNANGNYKVVITDDFGCRDSITVTATGKPDAGGDITVCAGTTATLNGIDPITGTWSLVSGTPSHLSLNTPGGGVANVVFTDAASGTYTFVYAIVGCADTVNIFVDSKPDLNPPADNSLCVGDITTISSVGIPGIWSANQAGIATITEAGVITAIASGTATFTFTDTITNCTATSAIVTVNDGPAVANTGTPDVCIGSTTTLTPTSGGTWASSDPSVATVTNTGIVTGVSAGSVTLVFTEAASACPSVPITVNVTATPVVSISGADSICINEFTTLLPSSGGSWLSSNTSIATVNNGGIVSGVAAGTVQFFWTDAATGCVSAATGDIVVSPNPTVAITGDNQICNGLTSTLSPTSGGTWVSSNPGSASVDPITGVVTAVSSGSARFTWTSDITGCSAQTAPIIVDPAPTTNASDNTICISTTSTLSPGPALGTWTAVNPGIASLATNGITVTGVAAGTAAFIYEENGTGCLSDTLFIVVDAGPTTSITGDDEICVGETSQLASNPAVTGTWMSSNPDIATINNSGVVIGIAPGVVTFTFEDINTGCRSLPSPPLTVLANPVPTITGDDDLCIGETTTVVVSPATAGTWTSSNTTVATINPATGVITAQASGSATFTFTSSTTGCISLPSAPVTVSERPTVNFTGPSDVCIGGNTTLAPTTGGTWSSSDPSVATITNAGVLTAVAPGTTVLTFTQTGSGCPSNGLTATINPTPTVSIAGDDDICIGETTTLSSDLVGGAWSSSNTTVAQVTNAGVVTGLAAGQATFRYTSADGCASAFTAPVVVNAAPTVSLPTTNICIDEQVTLISSVAGTWTSSNLAVATVDLNTGVVTGVSAGTVQFIFTDTANNCASPTTGLMTVDPRPATNISGPATICVGRTTTIAPTTGGTWSSTADSVATITNNGLVTGISPGTVRFIYTETLSGCTSDTSNVVTVTDGPTVTIADEDLCIGESTTLTPAIGGTWESSNPLVATVTNSGVVTAVAAGNAAFVFTDAGGCKSQPTSTLIVQPSPTVILTGSNQICIGATTTFTPVTGGTWASSNNAVATISAAGVVTGLTAGTVTFTFTDTATGCISAPTQPVSVTAAPVAEIDGPTEICIGGETTLTPSAGGTWTSSDPSIATVDNNGIVVALSSGEVSFSFQETATGCQSASNTGILTIGACADPDFNVTYVDVPVPGDVSTNDANDPAVTTYGTPVATGAPAGAVVDIDVNPDGTYEFTSNTVGVYTFDVPYCIAPQTFGCATAELTITVLDYLEPDNMPVANVDYGTTPINTPITLATLANDRCVVTTGCSLDATGVTVTVTPRNGAAVPDAITGDMVYTPNNNFVGFDTLTYQVCVTGEPTNCATADQIILVNAATAANSTQAADDFAVTPQAEAVTGNVADNDTDPEGDVQTVTGYTQTVAGVGTLVLANDGSYTFTPEPNFFGPVEFPYTTTDTPASGPAATADATLHILVVRDFIIKIRVYLEGALINNGFATGETHGRPLMRDELRNSPFTGSNYIPTTDPYVTGTPYTSVVPGKFTHLAPGARTEFTNINATAAPFAVTGEDAVVDWVFVELRSKADSTTVLATRSGLLQRDGDVAEMDGIWGLRFPGVAIDDYYVAVRHRNHLGAMTAEAKTARQLAELVDFSDIATGFYDFGTNRNIQDYSGLGQKYDPFNQVHTLWGGDFDHNNKVKFDNPNDDLNTLFFEVFAYPGNTTGNANFDFAYGYLQGDFDMNSKSKFDNPSDDKNILFFQVFTYPLNEQGFSSFDFIIEQIPND